MSSMKWSDEEYALLAALDEKGIPYKDMRHALTAAGFASRTSTSVKMAVHRMRRKAPEEARKAQVIQEALGEKYALEPIDRFWPGDFRNNIPAQLPADCDMSRASMAAKLEVLRGLPSEATALRAQHPGTNYLKTLVFSDTHGHLMRVDAIRAAVLSNLDARRICIVGDLFDFYDLSFFSSQVNKSVQEEWTIVAQLLTTLIIIFEEVIVVRGNHDMRIVRKIQKELNAPDLYPFMRGAFDPLSMICSGYGFAPDGELAKIYDFEGRVKYSQMGAGADGCLVQVPGTNTYLSHIDRYVSGSPGRTVSSVSGRITDVLARPHDCLIQGHTHSLFKGVLGNRLLLIECGCMSDEAEYVRNKALKYRPQSLGWVELHHYDDGSINIADTRVRYYGSGKRNV